MNLPEAMASVYRNYARGAGRASRSEYWWYYLVVVLVYLTVWAAGMILSTAMYGNAEDPGITLGATAIALFWLLANMIPSITVTVRRLHDVNLSGWYYFLQLIPYVGALALFVLTLLPSTRGHNLYGHDPREDRQANWRADATSSDFGDPRFGSTAPFQARITPVAAPGFTTPPAFASAPPYAQQQPYVQQQPYAQQDPWAHQDPWGHQSTPPQYGQQPPPPPPPPYGQQPPPPPPY